MPQISPAYSASHGATSVFDNPGLMGHFAHQLRADGAVVLDAQSGFFTEPEWASLETIGLLSGLLPYESVEIGDAGESNKVEVGRLMTDVEEPLVVNESISRQMLAILCAPQRVRFMEALLDMAPLHIRRAQINSMHKGSFIGVHVDQDSNPDYECSLVLQFGRAFEGGEFVIHLPDGRRNVIVPQFRSVVITRCDLAHEVCTVQGGTRTSLVYFVSRHAGHNRRYLSNAGTDNPPALM